MRQGAAVNGVASQAKGSMKHQLSSNRPNSKYISRELWPGLAAELALPLEKHLAAARAIMEGSARGRSWREMQGRWQRGEWPSLLFRGTLFDASMPYKCKQPRYLREDLVTLNTTPNEQVRREDE